ncbi:hypothetical protein RRG08_030654 [Elysia crispata]|uniref:Uncharacterized protein n=1 Tax=Elysia crispata TaxID=231223 RepID=A0AAE0YS07_9GAST|nr:hypothetical protein RRG08_030654 [Elysia crispata]
MCLKFELYTDVVEVAPGVTGENIYQRKLDLDLDIGKSWTSDVCPRGTKVERLHQHVPQHLGEFECHAVDSGCCRSKVRKGQNLSQTGRVSEV